MADRELHIDIETGEAERAIDRLIEKMERLLDTMDIEASFRGGGAGGDGAGTTVGTGRGPARSSALDEAATKISESVHEAFAVNQRVSDWSSRRIDGGVRGGGRDRSGDTLASTQNGQRWQSPASTGARAVFSGMAATSPGDLGSAAGGAVSLAAKGIGTAIGGAAGPVGAVVGEIGDAIVGKIIQGGQDYVQHVNSTMGTFVQASQNSLGKTGASEIFRRVSPADDYGYGGAEAVAMDASYNAASGLRAQGNMRGMSRLKRLGIEEGTQGRYAGLNRFGRASVGSRDLEEMSSVALDNGLRPTTLVESFTQALENSAQRGANIDGLQSADYMSRIFGADKTDERMGNAKAFGGLEGLRSRGSTSIDGFFNDMAGTLMEARAFEAAAKTGLTGFAGLNAVRGATEGAGFGAEGNAEFFNALLGEEATAGIAAATGDTSVAAGRNAARAAGRDTVAGSNAAGQTLDQMLLSEGLQAAIIKARSENITLGQGLGNLQVFQDLVTQTRELSEGSRSLANVARDLQGFIMGMGIR